MPVFADLPPQFQERIVCSIAAAVKYDIPANIVLAVAELEAGRPGQWVRNTNGTHDVGPMQFNTAYLAELNQQYGITPEDVAAAGCYSYDLAAWRLRMHIKNDEGDLWTKVANYHSRTPSLNAEYRHSLIRRALRWADWLKARFVTLDVTKPEAELSMPSDPVIPPEQEEVEQTITSPTPADVAMPGGETYVPRAISLR